MEFSSLLETFTWLFQMLQEHLMMVLQVEVPNLLHNQCNGVIPTMSPKPKELVLGEVLENAQCSHCIIQTYRKSLKNLLTLAHQVSSLSFHTQIKFYICLLKYLFTCYSFRVHQFANMFGHQKFNFFIEQSQILISTQFLFNKFVLSKKKKMVI